MGKRLRSILEAAGGRIKITHTGSSTIEGGWQSDSLLHHFKAEHPDGRVKHFSYDYDNNDIISHRKDPNRDGSIWKGDSDTPASKWHDTKAFPLDKEESGDLRARISIKAKKAFAKKT